MRRIGFAVMLAVIITIVPLAMEAQQTGKVARIGILYLVPPNTSRGFAALRQGLRSLGYVEGQNIALDYRWPPRPERLSASATELIRTWGAHERDGHRVGADAVARDAAGGVGGTEEGRGERPMTQIVEGGCINHGGGMRSLLVARLRRFVYVAGSLWRCDGRCEGPARMPKRPEKKCEPASPATRRVLPMELQGGDRLADETGDWEVIGRPYTTAGGKNAHVRVQRVKQPRVTPPASAGASRTTRCGPIVASAFIPLIHCTLTVLAMSPSSLDRLRRRSLRQ